MAWSEDEFSQRAIAPRRVADGIDEYHSESDGPRMAHEIAACLAQIGALLAERLPKPGAERSTVTAARLYTVKRGAYAGAVVQLDDLRFLSTVQAGVARFNLCYATGDPTSLYFDGAHGRAAAELERADILAAWGGAA